ncbi:MAG: hypothetical protein WD049_01080 [Candidatus Paceibacterota bacterium]
MSSSLGFVATHLIALTILYFVPVFICPTVVEHYATLGIPETPLFFRAHLISDFFAAYTPLLLGVAAIYLFVVYRRARAGSPWFGMLSNTVLLSIAFFGMIYTAWLISPMTLAAPQAGGATSAPAMESQIAESNG